MAKNGEQENKVINLVGSGTEINGDVICNGDIRIDGKLSGNLRTKGKMVIGESGRANGELHCKNADISGLVEGKIVISDLISLKPSSIVKGDIVANKLAIEPGAKFTGHCNMSGEETTESKKELKEQEK